MMAFMTSAPIAPEIPGAIIALARAARRITVLTGAGISAESGVPTFRDAQTGKKRHAAKVFGRHLFRTNEQGKPKAFLMIGMPVSTAPAAAMISSSMAASEPNTR